MRVRGWLALPGCNATGDVCYACADGLVYLFQLCSNCVLFSPSRYRDYQMLARMQLADGTWTFNEIQVNLSPFVALKSDKRRGHGAFVGGFVASVSPIALL